MRIAESEYGTRDARGHWTPLEGAGYPPVFVWPPQPVAAARWLVSWPGYVLPLNALYFVVAYVSWRWLSPLVGSMGEPAWFASILLRNGAIAFFWYGALHVALFSLGRQDTQFKFNPNWPSTASSAFLFGRQTADNMTWTCIGIVVWSGYEALVTGCLMSNACKSLDLQESPVGFVLLLLAIPLIQEAHFYLVHRFILHNRRIYKRIHKLHHLNTNPGPWSGLAMHPVEHVLYFSSVLVHLVIPSHPVHVLFHLAVSGLAPAAAHLGFQKIVVAGRWLLPMDGFSHYLHHKHFECNYSDGVIPLDRWFGTLHDGSVRSLDRLQERLRTRAGRDGRDSERRP